MAQYKNQKLITVVFIDDGINPSFIPNDINFENYQADEKCISECEPINGVSHGTVCYQIFHNNTHRKYKLISIKILDETGIGNMKALLSALRWCISQNVDLINMSMGTVQYTDFAPIAKEINHMSKTIIIAACSNRNHLTFPACLPNVIGVRHCEREELIDCFVYIPNSYDNIDVMTCIRDIPMMFGYGDNIIINGANSFATPFITAQVLEYVSQGYNTIDMIRQKLICDSVKDNSCTTFEFYKNLICDWNVIDIPIVALVDSSQESADTLTQLLNIFIKNGYCAIILSQSEKTCITNYTYELNTQLSDIDTIPNLIELYYNFAQPDILFLQIDLQELLHLPKKGIKADIILKSPATPLFEYTDWNEKHILDITTPPIALFSHITKLLS